jgi:NADH-quinone oxidoreductase subunit C
VSEGKSPKEPVSPNPEVDPQGGPPNADPAKTAEAVQPGVTQAGGTEAEGPMTTLREAEQAMDERGTEYSDPWGRGLYTDPDIEKHPALRELRANFPDAIVDVVRFRDETTIHLRRESLRDVCLFLKDHERLGFNILTDETAVDMLRLRAQPRFDVVVMLYSLKNRVRLRLKAGCNDGEPVPSLTPLWNGANWLEREVYDMFGLIFEGHPNLKRILLADDWEEGFPLRKDYPLRGWREYPVFNTERTVPRVRTRWTGRGV